MVWNSVTLRLICYIDFKLSYGRVHHSRYTQTAVYVLFFLYFTFVLSCLPFCCNVMEGEVLVIMGQHETIKWIKYTWGHKWFFSSVNNIFWCRCIKVNEAVRVSKERVVRYWIFVALIWVLLFKNSNCPSQWSMLWGWRDREGDRKNNSMTDLVTKHINLIHFKQSFEYELWSFWETKFIYHSR